MIIIDCSFAQLFFSRATLQRFLPLALLGTLGNACLLPKGPPAILNLTLLLILGLAQFSSSQHPVPPLTLNWWRKLCYWLLLGSLVLWLIAVIRIASLTAGLLPASDSARANLVAIFALMSSLMTGGLLYLFQTAL